MPAIITTAAAEPEQRAMTKKMFMDFYDENDTATFESDLAAAVNQVATDKERAAAFGQAGRKRAVRSLSVAP